VFSCFNSVTLAVADTSPSFSDQILQRNGGPYISFCFGTFKFILENTDLNFIRYIVKYKDVAIPFFVQPVVTHKKCGRRSNLKLVHYL
jgi:hypothetical protein